MPPDLLLAVTLGEVHEPAGIVLCQRNEKLGEFDKQRGRWAVGLSYTVERIEVFERAGRYAAIVDRVVELAREPKDGRVSLLVDATACGRPPIDLMRERKLKPIAAVLDDAQTGARAARRAMRLPKRELVACVSIVLSDRRLRVDRELANADMLAGQLERFRTSKPPGRSDVMAAWREQERDELVRALALALWWGENRLNALTKQPPVPRQPIPPEPSLTFDMAMQLAKRSRTAREKVTRI